jgi:hypothetical protein
MRRVERKMGVMFAFSIAVLISPGAWLALDGTVSVSDVIVWLVAPAGIACWVLAGTWQKIEKEDEAPDAEVRDKYEAALRKYENENKQAQPTSRSATPPQAQGHPDA